MFDHASGCTGYYVAGLGLSDILPGCYETPARIHAKAMFRRSRSKWGLEIPDPFLFT